MIKQSFLTDLHIPVKRFLAITGAAVGALTFAFTDSHWFNAVEAEVYSMSTFFYSDCGLAYSAME